jgi:hypothetical protein
MSTQFDTSYTYLEGYLHLGPVERLEEIASGDIQQFGLAVLEVAYKVDEVFRTGQIAGFQGFLGDGIHLKLEVGKYLDSLKTALELGLSQAELDQDVEAAMLEELPYVRKGGQFKAFVAKYQEHLTHTEEA